MTDRLVPHALFRHDSLRYPSSGEWAEDIKLANVERYRSALAEALAPFG